jgi:hypothetical protein
VQAAEQPWRAQDALGVPNWLRFALEHRSRFEYLRDDFRTAATGDGMAWVSRTLLTTELRTRPLSLNLELADSRAEATAATLLNNGVVDPLDVLQAYVQLRAGSWLGADHELTLTAGRFTRDLGARRLVARNDFRNTINSFTGVDLVWRRRGWPGLRAFATLPVRRLPDTPADLANHTLLRDRENGSALLSGLVIHADMPAELQAELYLLGLHEDDSAGVTTTNRRLWTPGLRLVRAPVVGRWDGQLELIGQFGKSRASTAAGDTTDLAHQAASLHLAAGWKFSAPWTPRLAVHYDYATGDADPKDGRQGRFDPLFGARRFEFGPTGLYGALARSNLSSPGVRLEANPSATLDAMAMWRPAWLVEAKDAWTTAQQRDPTGAAGTWVGQQWETRLRWRLLPGNLALEVGGAWLARGRFAATAPKARDGDPIYVYSQLTGSF